MAEDKANVAALAALGKGDHVTDPATGTVYELIAPMAIGKHIKIYGERLHLGGRRGSLLVRPATAEEVAAHREREAQKQREAEAEAAEYYRTERVRDHAQSLLAAAVRVAKWLNANGPTIEYATAGAVPTAAELEALTLAIVTADPNALN